MWGRHSKQLHGTAAKERRLREQDRAATVRGRRRNRGRGERPSAADEAAGWLRGSSPPRTSPRGPPRGMSPRTRYGESAACSCQRGHDMAVGIIASVEKPRTTVGDVVSDKAARGEGKRGAPLRIRPQDARGTVSRGIVSVNEAVHCCGRGHGGEKERGRPLQNVSDEAAGGGRVGAETIAADKATGRPPGCVTFVDKALSAEGRRGGT